MHTGCKDEPDNWIDGNMAANMAGWQQNKKNLQYATVRALAL